MKRTLLCLFALLAMPMFAMADHHEKAEKTIVETAVAAKFNTLVAAVKAAGLVEALNGEGPLTVFAPTDEAFAKLPKGTLEDLLKPENKDKLAGILKYHVVKGSYPAAKVLQNDSLETLQGSELKIQQTDKGVMVNNAKVVKTDVKASNGVIHVIDTVVLPSN